MHIPVDKVIQPTSTKDRVCSMDPGVRTFQTIYSPDGTIAEFGVGLKKIHKMFGAMDKLQSKVDKKEGNHRSRKNYKRVIAKIRYKIKNKIDEIHYKTIKYLTDNYDTIIIGKMDIQKMVKKDGGRKLNKKTVRDLYAWSHYKFRCRLEEKAKLLGKRVHAMNESYTSKTCGHCGHVHSKLGSSKTFKCPECGVVMGRDINGARNIMLRNTEIIS